MNKKPNRILQLCRWELETTYRFPIFELLLGVSGFLLLTSPPLYSMATPPQLVASAIAHLGALTDQWLFVFFLLFTIPLATSIAGAFETGELRVLLSAPVRRGELLATKILVNLLLLSGILGIFVGFRIALEFPGTVLLASHVAFLLVGFLLLMMGLRVLIICATTTFFAVLTKNSKITLFASPVFLILLTLAASLLPAPFNSFVNTGQSGMVLIAFLDLLFSETPILSQLISGQVLFNLAISSILLTAAIIYFYFMDVN